MVTTAALTQQLAAAPSTRRCRQSTGIVRAQQHPQQKQAADASPTAAATPVDRRALLLGAAAAVAASAAAPQAALAADECEFQTAANGLQWCDLVEGSGEAPVAGARIRAHYTGSLVSNGAVFDSSYQRGRPLVFQIGVGQVIKGWDQGILGTEDVPPMKPGGKRVLIIPSQLGYGARGAGGVIPPNADLRFLVEYLGKQGAR